MAASSPGLRSTSGGRSGYGGGISWPKSPRALDMATMPRLPGDKSLGEFMELGTNYEGSYRPARMGLVRALEAGKIRNPLQMPQSSRRPPSAGGTSIAASTGGPGSRPQSSSRMRGLVGGGSSSARLGGSKDFEKAAATPVTGGLPAVGDRGPDVLQPQRIELPSFLNTPARKPDTESLRPEEKTQAQRRIQDLELLTFACRRASKSREEGRAHFSLGVLRDNLGHYQKAIESYHQFLRVCRECNDNQGCALAYHCIAVDHQLLGSGATESRDGEAKDGKVAPPPLPAPMSARGTSKASNAPAAPPAASGIKPDLLRKAILFHNKHREHTDAVGKFVAHLNMGLAYALLGEKEAATVNHQYALRYALQLHSLEGQSLAIGSLSFSAGMYDNDPEKMRVLISRYVDLCGALKQTKNQTSALRKLGILAGETGHNEESIAYFQQAIDVAKAQGDREAEQDCSVRLGIAAGQARMAEHLSGILQQSVVRGRT